MRIKVLDFFLNKGNVVIKLLDQDDQDEMVITHVFDTAEEFAQALENSATAIRRWLRQGPR